MEVDMNEEREPDERDRPGKLESELAGGRSTRTPFLLLGGVALAVWLTAALIAGIVLVLWFVL
jgi:hypothetical protein